MELEREMKEKKRFLRLVTILGVKKHQIAKKMIKRIDQNLEFLLIQSDVVLLHLLFVIMIDYRCRIE